MQTNRPSSVFAGLIAGLIVSAGVGAYKAVRHNVEATPQPAIVRLEEELKQFEKPATEEEWKENFTVVRAYPNYYGDEQLVVVRDNSGRHPMRAVLTSGNTTYLVGDQVKIGVMRYNTMTAGAGSAVEDRWFVRHEK